MANKGVEESKLAEGSLPTSVVVSASQDPIVQVIPLERAPIAAVTVYTEAVAEVLRRIDLENDNGKLAAGATVEVVVEGLTRHVDKNSVRVNGHGPAKILHVSTESNFYNGAEDSATEGKKGTEDVVTKKLREELQECRATRTRLQQEYERVDRRLQLIQSYTNNVATQPSTNDKKPLGLQDFRGVLDFFSENAEDADGKRTQGEEVDTKIVALERQLMERGGSNQPHTNKETCAITVLVEVTGSGKIELELRYLVQGAQWHASYDVRISSAEGKTVGLTYYGLVSQATEEDWVNVHLSLSTATPSKGGVPPKLPTRHAKFWQPAVLQSRAMAMAKSSSSAKRKEAANFSLHAAEVAAPQCRRMMSDAPRGASFAALGGFGGGGGDAEDDEDEASIVGAVASVEVRSAAALGPSTFNIHKLTTIKCDRKPQKCTIGVLTLNSTFRHYVVPSKETNAYLQSKTLNVSDYTLMPSHDVSIFFDNNFVAKTELKLVQPGEEFQAFLGVDPAVRVDYSAPKTLTSSTGLFSRQKAKSYETVTTVTNQKGMPVRVAVVESLPLSQSDKIKVSLVAPAFESLTQVSVADDVDVGSSEESRASGISSDGTFLNKETNHVVFLRELAPKAKIQLPFKYTIDWPSGSEVVVEPAAPPLDPARFINRLF